MTPTLSSEFLERPLAHRALHDLAMQRPENSFPAVESAIAAGYGIEIDVQVSRDGDAMVFHDYALDRLTDEAGPVNERATDDLRAIPLSAGGGTIPTLAEIVDCVAGRVPLLIEIKDQDGALGENVGTLEAAVSTAVANYSGPVAVMSFNPHSVAAMAKLAPDIPRGLVTDPFLTSSWPVAVLRLAALRSIPDFERVGASFISHNAKFLSMPVVSALKAKGVPIICWTVRSAKEEAKARAIADNVTFEGYLPG